MSHSPDSTRFRAAWWIRGAHAQTLWGRIVRRASIQTRLERWDTTDRDFLELHRLAPRDNQASSRAPHVLLLHGLEGGVHSHYAQGLLREMGRRGWGADLLIWRSCGSEPNRARRFYHSGETEDLDFVVTRLLHERPGRSLAIVGVSLGGNVLLKYLGERSDASARDIMAAAAVSVPFDLSRGSDRINRGFSRVYQRYFLDSLKQKAIEKQTRYPDLPGTGAINALRTLREFDDALTAPLHGFAGANDYYTRSSALRFLPGIRVPTLLLSARDDPFLPPAVLREVEESARLNPALTVEFTERGGHAGFVGGRNPLRPVYYLEQRVGEFLASHAVA